MLSLVLDLMSFRCVCYMKVELPKGQLNYESKIQGARYKKLHNLLILAFPTVS